MTFAFVRTYDYPEDDGSDLDFGGDGYAIEFDTYPHEDSGDPPQPHIALIKGNSKNHLTSVEDLNLRDDKWHSVRIAFTSGRITVSIDDKEIISDYSIAVYTPFTGYFGFTAATGNGFERHLVRNIQIHVDAELDRK